VTNRRTLQVRGAPIIHDTIDNETIAINQQTGRYYSLEGPAADAWQELQAGATAESISQRLVRRYDVDLATASPQVDVFVNDLLEEGLIVEDGVAAVISSAAGPGDTTRAPFPGLKLHRYTDMEVLLLADPIHDVDETGWPAPQRESEA
jgi:hypothetical protein